MMSVTLIAFLAILVIAIFSRTVGSAPVSDETPEPRPLKLLENITWCPFEVKEDYDAGRIPRKIQKVVCKPTTPCEECNGVYQCIQAMVEFEVFYKISNRATRLPVEYGCYYTRLEGEEVIINALPQIST